MRQDARSRKVPLLISTLTPTADPYLNTKVAKLSAAIRSWAQRMQQPLADVSRAFATHRHGQLLSLDGQHPNDAGYLVLARTVATAIQHNHLPV
jgi:lysophospholipase L1-like esterase